MSTTIRIKRQTKDIINSFGSKDQSYDEVIMSIIHQRNILIIHQFFKENEFFEELDNEALVRECFYSCNIPLPQSFNDCGLNGEGIIPFNMEIFHNCCEMATDEDLIGHNRVPSNTEIVTNSYCLMWDIPAPTWSLSGMTNPFRRF